MDEFQEIKKLRGINTSQVLDWLYHIQVVNAERQLRFPQTQSFRPLLPAHSTYSNQPESDSEYETQGFFSEILTETIEQGVDPPCEDDTDTS